MSRRLRLILLAFAVVAAGIATLLVVANRDDPAAAPSSPSVSGGGAPVTLRSTTTKPTTTKPTTTKAATTTRLKDESGLKVVAASTLPKEAQETLRLIEKGGPFPYERDGIVFENREGLLPKQASGYYREYTVVTPGSDDRGARRIVAGNKGERYYSADHYASFVRVAV